MLENKRRILNSPLVTIHGQCHLLNSFPDDAVTWEKYLSGLGPLTVTFKKKGLDNYQMLEYTNCSEK